MNQLKAGALLSYVNIILTVVVGLTYTPVMLRLLGQSEYGLYSLIGSFVAYLSVLDMGLGNTIVRYTAKNRADGDKNSEAELNGLFLAVYSFIGVITLIAGAIMYANLGNLFGDTLDAGQLERAKVMMVLLIINVAFSFPLAIFSSIMNAYERFIFLRTTNILRVVLQPVIILPLLYCGFGVVMMVVVTSILNFACLFANMYYCFRYLHISIKFGRYDKSFLYEISGFSFFVFLNAIMDKIYWGSGQFVLGIISGTIQVAIYAIAMQFMNMYMQFSCAISGVMLPKVTMMVANEVSSKELTDLMIKVGRLQYIVIGFILFMFVVVGEQFIALWAGINYLPAYPIVIILMVAMIIPLVQNVGISIILAMNLNRYRMTVYTICALVSIVISFPVAKLIGGLGCAICTAVSLVISTGYFMNRYYKDKIGLDIWKFWKNILYITIFTLIFIVISFLIQHVISFGSGWKGFVVQSLLFTILYSIIMYFGAMNAYEKGLVNKTLAKVLRRG